MTAFLVSHIATVVVAVAWFVAIVAGGLSPALYWAYAGALPLLVAVNLWTERRRHRR